MNALWLPHAYGSKNLPTASHQLVSRIESKNPGKKKHFALALTQHDGWMDGWMLVGDFQDTDEIDMCTNDADACKGKILMTQRVLVHDHDGHCAHW